MSTRDDSMVMNMNMRCNQSNLAALTGLWLLTGCPGSGLGDVAPDPETGSDASTGGVIDDGGSATSGPAATTGAETGAADAAGSTGCTFLCNDGGILDPDCDPWAQDCPDNEKCNPWANDGGTSWNALKCVPVAPDPGQPGDACTVEGSGVSGVDDCDVAAMCWDVDPETNQGICVAFCQGSPGNPACDDPSTQCVIANDGALNLCLPSCDPLGQDCVDGQACYPVAESFACAPDASGPDQGTYGDPCEFLNSCDPGLFCAAADAVPGCAESQGCCSEFCDLSTASPGAACSGQAGGQDCVPWYDEGTGQPGTEDYGACAIPE